MPEAARNLPIVTAIVPVRNEEANIAAAVESLAAQVPPIEIVVVNDDSSDGTPEILAGLQKRFPNLRVIDNHELPAGWTGKNHACYLGAKQAKGEWLLFTDADVRHAPQAVEAGLALARQHDAKLVSYSPNQDMETWWERVIIPYVYFRLARAYPFEEVNNPKSSIAAANGQWLLVSRRAYRLLGGHESVRGEILEDVALARKVKRAGYRIYFTSAEGKARTRMYSDWQNLWQGWTKNLHPLWQGAQGSWARGGCGRFLGGLFDFALLLFFIFFSGALYRTWYVLALALLGFVFLLSLNDRYWRYLEDNQYPKHVAVFYFPAIVLFYALVVSSWFAHRVRGKVVWKGRSYKTDTAK